MTTHQRIAQFTYSGTGARVRLPQLLTWDRYVSAEQHELELERLFRPAWHCVALRDDIPEKGDYVTVDLLGLPLLVQNQGDRIAAFYNVCAHRNSILARAPRGHMDRITCGYHGWQYDRDGVACTIPGGECFKPMKPREFALDRVRVETIGRLVFACLDASAGSLESFLGPEMHARLAHAFGPSMRPADSWTIDYTCNWKVLVENSLEDYHVTLIHQATAGDAPPARQIEHTLGPNYNVIENRSPDFDNPKVRWVVRQMRSDAEFTYFQYISFPSLIFASTPISSHMHVLLPTSPTTCRVVVRLLLPDGGGLPLGRALRALLRRRSIAWTRAFVEEDRTICNDVQRGLAVARFPGVLGAREERVHHFQEWLLAATGVTPG